MGDFTTLEIAQQKRREWLEKRLPVGNDRERSLLMFTESALELCDRFSEGDVFYFRIAVGDCIMALCDLCNFAGVSIESATYRALDRMEDKHD